jgi:hypothetical protein
MQLPFAGQVKQLVVLFFLRPVQSTEPGILSHWVSEVNKSMIDLNTLSSAAFSLM